MRLKLGFKYVWVLAIVILAYSGMALADNNGVTSPSSTTPTSSGGSSSSTSKAAIGVNPKIQKAMLLNQDLHQQYDRSAAIQLIEKPSSVAALSCLDKVVESYAKNSAGLFSKDYTQQVKDPIKGGLESLFKNFSWDQVVSYSMSFSIQATCTVDASASLAPSTGGPTLKDVECKNMQSKWESKRREGIKKTPTFNEAIKMLSSSSSGDSGMTEDQKAFKNVWQASSTSSQNTSDIKDNTTPVFTIDSPLAKGKGLCDLLTNMGIQNDCDTNTNN